MKHYNATVEVDQRPDPNHINPNDFDTILDQLAGYSTVVAISPRGWLQITITIPADNLTQAATTTLALIEKATGHTAVAADIMTTVEYDLRQGIDPIPELVSVTEAATHLGVTRQAILDRVRRRTLPATKVGREYVIPRSALTSEAP